MLGWWSALCLVALCAFGMASQQQDTRVQYIGGDALLRLQAGGRYDVLQLDREALGKCDPFPKPTSIKGTFQLDDGDSLVYIGGQQLLRVNAGANRFHTLTCEISAKSGEEERGLNCRVTSNSTSDVFSDPELDRIAYVEPDKLVLFSKNTGRFSVHGINKQLDCSLTDECGIQSAPLLSGTLDTLCSEAPGTASPVASFAVVGSGVNTIFVACKSQNSYAIGRFFTSSSAPGSHDLLLERAGTMDHPRQLTSLGGTLLLGLNPDSADYQIVNCNSASCLNLWSDTLNKEFPCMYTTQSECVQDRRCGFCLETGVCLLAGNNAPCSQSCDKWVSNATAPVVRKEPTVATPERELVYIDDRVVMHYVSALGSYKLLQLVDNHPSHCSKCPSFAPQPLYSGTLPYRHYVATSFNDRSVLFHNPETGDYAVWTCQAFSFEAHLGSAAPCATSAVGTWDQLRGNKQVLTTKRLTAVLDAVTGNYSVYANARSADGSEDQFMHKIFADAPVFTTTLPELKAHKLIRLGTGYVLEYNPADGAYRAWMVDGRTGKLHGPGARGTFPGRRSHQLAWVGDDRLMSILADGAYLAMRFETTTVSQPLPLGLTALGRGSLTERPCEYHSCDECTADPVCGWCSTTNSCMPGNVQEPCNDGSGNRCPSWMKNYCAATACASRMFRLDCIADTECGWCETTGLCYRQRDGVAVGNECSGNLTLASTPRLL